MTSSAPPSTSPRRFLYRESKRFSLSCSAARRHLEPDAVVGSTSEQHRRSPGFRYKPGITKDPSRPAGTGATSFWGDIVISTKGSAQDQALVLLHERVHQALAPRFYLLRDYRVSNRAGSYVRSSLWRYIEEAMAETVAQVGVRGVTEFLEGVRFPVANGYVYLTRTGGYNPQLAGSGVFPEAAALLHQGVVAGIALEVKYQAGPAPIPAWAVAQ